MENIYIQAKVKHIKIACTHPVDGERERKYAYTFSPKTENNKHRKFLSLTKINVLMRARPLASEQENRTNEPQFDLLEQAKYCL